MRRYKRALIGFVILICLIIVVHEIMYTIDRNDINNRKKPKFIISEEQYKDGGTTVYYGLGYQIIDWDIKL